MNSERGKPPTIFQNSGHHVSVVVLLGVLVLGFSARSLEAEDVKWMTKMDRPYQVVAGDSVTVELLVMPEKYQIIGGYALEVFTASSDSSFWCGPNRPHPFSWLTRSVMCRKRTDFQILFFTMEGDTLDVLDFVDVEPATYRVDIDRAHELEPGLYTLEYRYNGVVVDESRILIQEPK